jgi:hypothetical protein
MSDLRFDDDDDEPRLTLAEWESEDRLRTLRESGEEPVDLWGRPRVAIIGNGPEARLARATYRMARTRRLPESDGFGLASFRLLYKAVAFANLKGLVLNTAVTVSWSTVGIDDDRCVSAAHTALVRRLREWCTERRHPIPCVLIWVKERSERLGVHSHLLAHVEARHRAKFGAIVRDFVAKYAGVPALANHRGEDGRPVSTLYVDGPNARSELEADEIRFQWSVFRYLMKGATMTEWVRVVSPCHARLLFRDFAGVHVRDQGTIRGKRVGTSTRSLGNPAWLEFAMQNEIDERWLDREFDRHGPRYDRHYKQTGENWRQMRSINDRWSNGSPFSIAQSLQTCQFRRILGRKQRILVI